MGLVSNDVGAYGALTRASAYSVRCFRNEYVAPTTYTLTFDSQSGTEVASQTVVEGQMATEPSPAPTKDGYTFVGWYSDEELTQAFDFLTAITEDITLYAKWYNDACSSSQEWYDDL